MERGKSVQGRGGKSKTPQYPADLYALGSKASNEGKRSGSVHGKPGPSHSLTAERKREGVTPPSLIPSKKAKLSTSVVSPNILPGRSGGNGGSTSISATASTTDAWEALAAEVDSVDFATKVIEAINADEPDRLISLVCGAIRTLKIQRNKPDSALMQGLLLLAKIRHTVFHNEHIVSALSSLLRREPAHAFKSKSVPVTVMAVSLLMRGYLDLKRWPEMFVKLYIEDSLGERTWVDQSFCKPFVDNILTAFNTKPPPPVELDTKPEQIEEQEVGGAVGGGPSASSQIKDLTDQMPVFPRYSTNQDAVESTVLEIVKETLNRRQAPDNINKNFLKLLASAAGLVEVRVLVSSKLEVWLQNPKLLRPAQELLMAVCVNCSGHTQKDVEVISALVKVRLKSKAVISYYLSCILELITAHPDNLSTVLKHTIYNELSQSRNPNNLSMLAVMFQYNPETAATILADIFQELLLNRDDYLRPLRALLREVWRSLRSDLNLSVFCRGLMSQTEPLPRDCEFSQRTFAATADLITLCMFLATATYARPDKKDPQPQLEEMQMTVAGIQSDAVWWLQETALRIYRPSPADFVRALHKVLLMEQPDQYYKLDNWPPETDRALFMRLASEIPLLQNILLRVLVIGLSKEHPLSPAEALELADQLVRRAAAIPTHEKLSMLIVDKLEVMELVFNLCAYHHPDNIDLPAGYTPPTLAITNLYWKGWILLTVLCAHNPETVGAEGWEKYPTLRVMMEMCITNHFVVPHSPDELQLLALEKQAILQFESHLAAASTKMAITEQTSLLLSQLMGMDPKGPSRRPPPGVLEQLQTLNSSLRLGHLLCRSRRPDFLLDIIQRQGASQSMPWLADLVHSSDASLSHLPVQCLCEFLLSSSSKQQQKYQQLLTHLQNILSEPTQDPVIVCEVLDYFLRRLSSLRNRAQAITGLKLVLSVNQEEETIESTETKEDTAWLLKQLPSLPHFSVARPQIIAALRSACQVENDPNLITSYLCFLAQHMSSDLNEMTELVVDMAQLIVERSTIMSAILPSQMTEPSVALDAFITIFYIYLNKAREPQREAYTWSESQDQILVTWPSGEQCTLYILVVHAMVIILTYGPQCVTEREHFQHLLDAWFPVNKEDTPKAFLVDTSEEALLIPDWLKLRIIRSKVPRLVDAALTDLEPPQLILFIQSFGIPVESMSKLLETLDRAVLTDEISVGDAVLDKAYMVQLVEVQHKRGAKGGETFARVLGLQESIRPPDVEITIPEPMDVSVKAEDSVDSDAITDNEAIGIFECIFLSDSEAGSEKKIIWDYFQTLQRITSFELSASKRSGQTSPVLKSLMVYLLKKVTCDKIFVQLVVSKSRFACPFFRLLMTVANPDLVATFLVIAKILYSEASKNARAKPLAALLKEFIGKREKRDVSLLRSMASTEDPKKVFEETPITRLESVGNTLLESSRLRVQGTDSLVEATVSLLMKSKSDQEGVTGLLIDWLVRLEPEIVGACTDQQMMLLFSREIDTCRPYLLTLLTHQASWTTLHNCTSLLLTVPTFAQYNATTVLDFLHAITCNPKLWKGRERYVPKHRHPEDILCLPLPQLLRVTEYIVEEGVTIGRAEEVLDKMNSRLSFLVVYDDNEVVVKEIVNHIKQHTVKSSGDHRQMWQQLLALLYLHIPRIIQQISQSYIDKYLVSSPVTITGSSAMDAMSHTLVTALTATPPVKDWSRRSQELELATRKMAATHPLLLLRQLRMLATSLRGRVHLEFSVFRSRNHYLLFNQVCGLLEQLKPYIFQEEYSEPFHQILDIYFQLFKQHGHLKELVAMLNRIVGLLQAYISHSAERAHDYLQTQAALISELQSQQPILSSMCIMMSGIREQCKGSEVHLQVAVPPQASTYDAPPSQLDSVIAGLHGPDPLSSLQDLDQWSVRRPALLEPALSDLCELLSSHSSALRSLAHGLVARFLRYAPNAGMQVLNSYLACLNSEHYEVVMSTLDRLPEIVVCSQEVALPLLSTAFCLNITSGISTTQCISKTVSLLNLQSGC